MDNSSYVSLSLATAMRREMDVTANNIANANTVGFKGERLLFESYMRKDTGNGDGTSFVIDKGSYMDSRQGALLETGNPLDVALQGPGWFSYQSADGQRVYGRDGSFTIDPQGNLVTANGAQVLDTGGSPIALPPDLAASVEITRDGAIVAPGAGTVAQLGVFDVPDLQTYQRIGGGMLLPPEGAGQQAPLPAVGTQTVQGALEASNVEPVVEVTRMMSIQRAYERALNLMNSEDDLRRDMLRRLGQTA